MADPVMRPLPPLPWAVVHMPDGSKYKGYVVAMTGPSYECITQEQITIAGLGHCSGMTVRIGEVIHVPPRIKKKRRKGKK